MRHYRLWDTVALLFVAITLIWPIFKLGYVAKWQSIEGTFIADGRILAEHMPHVRWQPLWYCGTRFDYIYPPALRYGTALISLLGHTSTARAYHIYVGLLYVLGPVSVYWLVLIESRSRIGAWLSALAVATLSPCLVLVHQLWKDDPWMVPQRLHALMDYGEGPHISALSVIPAAITASFIALRWWRPRALALAGVLCAFIVANNFYGAVALAVLFPVAAWSVWLGKHDKFLWWRATGIVALAYGLSAFWLTPSYIAVTMADLKLVSKPGNPLSQILFVVVIIFFREVSYRWADRRSDRVWPVFVCGSVLILGMLVLGGVYFGWRVLGEPARLAPELDVMIIILLVMLIMRLWKVPRLRFDALALSVVLALPTFTYAQHIYGSFVGDKNWDDRYEYHLAKWVHDNLPGERVMPAGTSRIWYDAWYDNPQTDGGSDQGLINQLVPAARYQLTQNDRADLSVLWLQALGTSAVIVPDSTSLDSYRDYFHPKKFQGVLPVIFDDGHGTLIYRVPRIYKSLGRVVDRDKLTRIGALNFEWYAGALKHYVSLVEAPQPETSVTWSSFESLKVNAIVGQGQSVLLQETYDPAWHAYENGTPLKIKSDETMQFMLIDVAPGVHTINLQFEIPLENRIGQLLLVISSIATVSLLTPLGRKLVLKCEPKTDAPF